MSDVTISGLPAASAVAATDVLPMDISAASATQKATAQQLVNTGLVSPGPIGGTTPAAVTGTNLTATGGAWVKATWGGATYTDGVLVDYNSPEGRIAVGASDTLGIYINGTGGTKVASFNGTGIAANTYQLASAGIITEATTSRTLSATDNGAVIYCTSGSAVTITTAVSLGAGFSCTIIQGGAGQITVAQGASTTLVSYGSLVKTAGQYALASIICPVANTFYLAGNLGA